MTTLTRELRILPRGAGEICLFRGLRTSFPPHFHSHWLLGCLLAGTREFVVGKISFILHPLVLILLAPFIPHSCSAPNDEPCDWLCAGLPFKSPPPGFEPGYLGVCENSQLARAFASACLNGARKDPPLVEKFIQPRYFKPLPAARADFAPLRLWLDANLQNKITLADMSRVAAINPFSLVKTFAAKAGLTPWRYVEVLRVNRAKSLIQAGTALKDAALDAGFYDQSHLNRRFKSFLGFTPGYFRSVCHGDENA